MKKLLIILLLSVNSLFAQTSLPSSGPISMSEIATVMYNLGEITSGELAASYSIAFLNGKSHLSDKTAPYSLSDWYGYTGAVVSYPYSAISVNQNGNVCAIPGTSVTVHSASTTLTYGSRLYSDSGLTTPVAQMQYKISGSVYVTATGTGAIVQIYSCP